MDEPELGDVHVCLQLLQFTCLPLITRKSEITISACTHVSTRMLESRLIGSFGCLRFIFGRSEKKKVARGS